MQRQCSKRSAQANISCVQMMLEKHFLEPTVLHFTQHTCGAAIVMQNQKSFKWQIMMHLEFRSSFQVQVIMLCRGYLCIILCEDYLTQNSWS